MQIWRTARRTRPTVARRLALPRLARVGCNGKCRILLRLRAIDDMAGAAPQYAQRQPVMFASSCEFGQVCAAWVNAGDLGHAIATVTYVNLDSGHRALTQGDVTWVKREVTYVANLPRVTQISLAAPPRVSRRDDRVVLRLSYIGPVCLISRSA